MTEPFSDPSGITPEILLKAYAIGIFPMAESADDPGMFWIEPKERGILPLDDFYIPSRLARTIRSNKFDIRINTDFDGVIAGCGDRSRKSPTWINTRIRNLYRELYNKGFCHTVETWFEDKLVGGLYGVSLGAAFFGESMFSTMTDASKVALAHLAERLKAGGYQLLDTQFTTDHLKQFGAISIAQADYIKLLENALIKEADFFKVDAPTSKSD